MSVKMLLCYRWTHHVLLYYQGARLQARETQGYETDSKEDDDDQWVDDELGYISPRDNIDVYKTFNHALHGG
ncbi:MAG TPA: hypothetical protein VGO47_14420 [Chlamydiales bacterium]|nr:hypothetical protein [Chlamydiales bacterium]